MRGSILQQQALTVQVNNPARNPDGGLKPNWQDVLATTGKVTPLSARVRVEFMQQGMTVSHKVRLEGWPTWTPLAGKYCKDRGHLWPGIVRLKYADANGLVRVLTYQGSYSPAEAGRWTSIMCNEDTEEAQFING